MPNQMNSWIIIFRFEGGEALNLGGTILQALDAVPTGGQQGLEGVTRMFIG